MYIDWYLSRVNCEGIELAFITIEVMIWITKTWGVIIVTINGAPREQQFRYLINYY